MWHHITHSTNIAHQGPDVIWLKKSAYSLTLCQTNIFIQTHKSGGYFLVKDYWGCAAGWGRIFTTGLTIMGLHFQ